jgi:fluoride ion exporter CrcB/FEX
MKVRTRPTWREVVALGAMAGVGGCFGAAMRLGAERTAAGMGQPGWTAHVAVNVVGGGLAGWFVGMVHLQEATDPLPARDRPLRRFEHLLLTGFLGGLTTISGFAWDVARLAQEYGGPAAESAGSAGATGPLSPAVALAVVLAANGVAGLVAAWVGLALGRRAGRRSARGRP